MKTTEALKHYYSHKWFYALITLLIALGIFFRFVNIDQKIYWADEAFTSLRISGYTLREVAQVSYNQIISVEDFQKYQHLNPDKNIGDTVRGLITEEPQLTPLYFVMVRLWSQCFGSSIAAIRSFSAVLGLLALPAMYWLCIQLFRSNLSAWIGTALIAVSPLYVLYSQEARPYSLLTLVVLLSSCLLLRSLQQPTRMNWMLYSIAVAVSLYSHLFFAFALLGHGIYILTLKRFRIDKSLVAYLLASMLGVMTFMPWMIAISLNKLQVQTMTSWTDEDLSRLSLMKVWAGNISRLFLDLGFNSSLVPLETSLPLILPILLLLLLLVYAIYFLCSHAPPRIWLFVLSLIGVTALLLWLPDLISSKRQSTSARYSITLFLGIQLAFTYLFSVKLFELKLAAKAFNSSSQASIDIQRQRSNTLSVNQSFWQVLIAIIFSCSIFSCILSAHAQIWWNKSPQYTRNVPLVAHLINQTSDPLIISVTASDGDLMRVESLSYLLKAETQLQFITLKDTLDLPDSGRNTFVYLPNSSQPSLEQFQQKLKQSRGNMLKLIPNTDNTLFKLEAKD